MVYYQMCIRDWHSEAILKPALLKQASGVLKKIVSEGKMKCVINNIPHRVSVNSLSTSQSLQFIKPTLHLTLTALLKTLSGANQILTCSESKYIHTCIYCYLSLSLYQLWDTRKIFAFFLHTSMYVKIVNTPCRFAFERINWDQTKVDSLLLPLLRRLNSEQKLITHYLGRSPLSQEPPPPQKSIKSKRIRNVVARFTHKGQLVYSSFISNNSVP